MLPICPWGQPREHETHHKEHTLKNDDPSLNTYYLPNNNLSVTGGAHPLSLGEF